MLTSQLHVAIEGLDYTARRIHDSKLKIVFSPNDVVRGLITLLRWVKVTRFLLL